MPEKTIAQIAKDIGVQRQSVYRKIKAKPLSLELQQYIVTRDGVTYVSDMGQTIVYKAFEKLNTSQSDNKRQSQGDNKRQEGDSDVTVLLKETILALQGQLDVKDKQIERMQAETERLTSALENVTESLKASQVLHAGTMQNQLTDGSTTHPEDESVPGGRGWRFWQRKK